MPSWVHFLFGFMMGSGISCIAVLVGVRLAEALRERG